MADEVKKILFSVEVDTAKSVQSVNALAVSYNNLDQAKDKDTEATKRQESASTKNATALKAEEDSIAKLRQRNKELTAERNNTSTATEAGRAKIAALNAELNKNNDTIKANVDALTQQKIGIGGYEDAINKALPGVGGFIQGIRGMTTAGLTFIATPIGMVIAAIGLALGALMAYFKGSEEGQNNLNKIMLIGSSIMEKVMDVVEGVGEALFNAFTNPKQAMTDLYEFVKQNLINRFTAFKVILEGIMNLDFKQISNGVIQAATGVENMIDKVGALADEIKSKVEEAIDQGSRLAAFQAKIDKDERALIVERGRISLEVSKLRAQAIREEGAVKEETVKKAIALEESLADKEVALAKIRLANAELLRDTNGADKEALDEVAKATAAVAAAEEQRFSATLRFQKELEKLREAEIKEQERIEAEQAKTNEEIRLQKEKERIEQARIEAEQAENNRKVVEENKKKAADKEIEIEKLKSNAVSGLISKVTKGRIDGQKLYTTIFKKGALAETYANTKAAAIAAYKSLAGIPIVGPVLGVIAGAAATLYGLTQATGIQAIGFARSGRVPLSGTKIKSGMGLPITRDNGDDLLVTAKRGEVILNERHQAMLGGSKTFARIGVPGFADSGLVGQQTYIASTDAQNQQNLIDIANAIINQPQKILVLEEVEAKQRQLDDIRNKANII
jgi:hypothetical protein